MAGECKRDQEDAPDHALQLPGVAGERGRGSVLLCGTTHLVHPLFTAGLSKIRHKSNL